MISPLVPMAPVIPSAAASGSTSGCGDAETIQVSRPWEWCISIRSRDSGRTLAIRLGVTSASRAFSDSTEAPAIRVSMSWRVLSAASPSPLSPNSLNTMASRAQRAISALVANPCLQAATPRVSTDAPEMSVRSRSKYAAASVMRGNLSRDRPTGGPVPRRRAP